MTVLELVKEIRKPGRIYMPVMLSGDVTYVAVEKSDLLDLLLCNYLNSDPAPWAFYGEHNGHRKLDVA